MNKWCLPVIETRFDDMDRLPDSIDRSTDPGKAGIKVIDLGLEYDHLVYDFILPEFYVVQPLI